MASVGQELKRERELRGISLKEIADSTKINIRFLRALEEDRLDMLPEKFFTRGIIRTYAKYLGLDEQGILNTYLEDLHSRQTQEASPEDKKPDESERTESFLKKKKNTWLWIIMILIMIVLLVVMYFVLRKHENPPPITPTSEASLQKTQAEQSPPPPVVKEEPEPAVEELNLEIAVQQETWLEIYADQEMVESGNKIPGEHLQYKARKEFFIHTGNAGGFTYTINGEEGIPLGEPGVVRRDTHISLENYRDYIAKKRET